MSAGMRRAIQKWFCAGIASLAVMGLAEGASGWLTWRGPHQNGTSRETGFPEKLEAKDILWTAELPGQSTPVIANDRLYIMGYRGAGRDLQEVLACFEAASGKLLWERAFNDFLSDTIYERYSTASPAVDPETGNVYMQGTQGILACFSAAGDLLWSHSLMEKLGRLTFPNSRTASPVIDGELVITRGITSNWGAQGAASDRFYAFDKKTGELVWASSPAERPQDNTFSHPYLSWIDGMRVLFSAAGDCSLVALNARTGDPLWRVPVAKSGAKGGVNAAVVQHRDDKLIVIHESENLDSSEIGRMAAFRISRQFAPDPTAALLNLDPRSLELWRNEAGSLASSPVLAGDTLYQVGGLGDLYAVDANTGKILWKKKLGIEQRQSSPFYAEGRLYIAMYISALGEKAVQAAQEGEAGAHGDLFVIKPEAQDARILSQMRLRGKCYGSPIGCQGRIYVQTDRQLYCFGKAGAAVPPLPPPPPEPWPKPGPPARLQPIPAEATLHPGESVPVRVRVLDEKGFTVSESADVKSLAWSAYVPPTARVKSYMKGAFNEQGHLVAAPDRVPSAGAFQVTMGELKGVMRARVLPNLPLREDFEAFQITEKATNAVEGEVAFAYPPLPWIGARFRFEVREKDGAKALCKTVEDKRFQRGTVFIGTPEMKNYTVEADVMSEGNRRKMSEVGLINQRYLVVLKGNSQELEINSNLERLKQAVPFKWTANTWYRLKTRVDAAPDGSAVVRAKAWKRDEPEPAEWTLEVPHAKAHPCGSPGLFSFAPQEMRAYLDNILVTPN